jgi:dTDP-glucose pyrophosphorylase/CBS domain-containing protein
MNAEVIPANGTVSQAVGAIERGRKTIAVLVDSDGLLVGTISDGDVRRAILRGVATDAPARDIANPTPTTVPDGTSEDDIARLLTQCGLEALPIVDASGRFLRTAFIEDMTRLKGTPASAAGYWAAVIMAGGEGKRLRPYTDKMPKPMLHIGGMPIMERNIRSLARLGVPRFFLSINYLGHIIEQHFADGAALGTHIAYLREDEPLGTGGALGLIDEPPGGPILIMNGDLITGIDVGKLLAFHNEHGAQITVAAKEYRMEVPFGVLQTAGAEITGMREKPSERFLCNAGIYVLHPQVIERLPRGPRFDMTTLIEIAMREKRKVVAFPLFELWHDVGTPSQLEEARAMLELGELSNVR